MVTLQNTLVSDFKGAISCIMTCYIGTIFAIIYYFLNLQYTCILHLKT